MRKLNADSDRDGRSNLLEWRFGFKPCRQTGIPDLSLFSQTSEKTGLASPFIRVHSRSFASPEQVEGRLKKGFPHDLQN
jgi:hypothetical protein